MGLNTLSGTCILFLDNDLWMHFEMLPTTDNWKNSPFDGMLPYGVALALVKTIKERPTVIHGNRFKLKGRAGGTPKFGGWGSISTFYCSFMNPGGRGGGLNQRSPPMAKIWLLCIFVVVISLKSLWYSPIKNSISALSSALSVYVLKVHILKQLNFKKAAFVKLRNYLQCCNPFWI
jgi:hypothetical protein